MKPTLNIICLLLLLLALAINLRAYRRMDESKKFQGQIALTLTVTSVLLLGSITISDLT